MLIHLQHSLLSGELKVFNKKDTGIDLAWFVDHKLLSLSLLLTKRKEKKRNASNDIYFLKHRILLDASGLFLKFGPIRYFVPFAGTISLCNVTQYKIHDMPTPICPLNPFFKVSAEPFLLLPLPTSYTPPSLFLFTATPSTTSLDLALI